MDPDSNLDGQLAIAGRTLRTWDRLDETVRIQVGSRGHTPQPGPAGLEDEFHLLEAAQHLPPCQGASPDRYRAITAAECTCGAWKAQKVIRDLLNDGHELSGLVEALDGWITGSGFLPHHWRRP